MKRTRHFFELDPTSSRMNFNCCTPYYFWVAIKRAMSPPEQLERLRYLSVHRMSLVARRSLSDKQTDKKGTFTIKHITWGQLNKKALLHKHIIIWRTLGPGRDSKIRSAMRVTKDSPARFHFWYHSCFVFKGRGMFWMTQIRKREWRSL